MAQHDKFFMYSFILFFSIFIAAAALAAEAQPAAVDIAKKLQEKYEEATTIQADFRQITTLQMRRRSRYGKGTVVIKKPGQMRWDYREPDPQVLLSDGDILSIYTAKNNQMITGPAKTYLQSDVTYKFFTGSGNILTDFSVQPTRNDTSDDQEHIEGFAITLVPRMEHPHVEIIDLVVDPDSWLVNRLKITDRFGSVTDFIFTNFRINEDVSDSHFTFTPPEGTEIINQ